MDEVLFGTAGIPINTPKPGTSTEAVDYLAEIGLQAMELEFVRSVFLTEQTARDLGKRAANKGIVLTAHASYYVNLNAKEPEKVEASKERILQAARVAAAAGAYSVTFHPGFYLKQDPKEVAERITAQVKDVVRTLKDEGVNIWVRPETTGKPTQFGSLHELLALSREVDMVMPCIDFAHLHARSNGAYNTAEEFEQVYDLVEEALGAKGLRELHVHFSGIEYTEKGERKHLTLEQSDFDWEAWLHVTRRRNVKGVFISESPNIEQDALLAKNYGR